MIKKPHHISCRLMALTLLVLAILGSCRDTSKAPWADVSIPPRDPEAKYDGIDISSYQGYIDWAKVSSDKDIRFVYIKATEGATYHSPHYAHNVTQARRHGLLVGSLSLIHI